MKYEVLYDDGIFEVKTYDDAKHEGFIGFWQKLITHDKWKPGSRILSDHSELNCGPLTVNDIKLIADNMVKLKTRIGQARLAHVVTRDLEYGMIRMRQVYVEGRWDVVERVFRSREEALSWLKDV